MTKKIEEGLSAERGRATAEDEAATSFVPRQKRRQGEDYFSHGIIARYAGDTGRKRRRIPESFFKTSKF